MIFLLILSQSLLLFLQCLSVKKKQFYGFYVWCLKCLIFTFFIQTIDTPLPPLPPPPPPPCLKKHLSLLFTLSTHPLSIHKIPSTQTPRCPFGTKLIEDDWFFPGCSDPALATRQQELEEELDHARGLGKHRAKNLNAPGPRSLQVGG